MTVSPVDIIILLIGLHFAAPGLMPINLPNMLLTYGSNMLLVIAVYLVIKYVKRIGMDIFDEKFFCTY